MKLLFGEPEGFSNRGVLKNFIKFTEKNLYQSLFLILLKKRKTFFL